MRALIAAGLAAAALITAGVVMVGPNAHAPLPHERIARAAAAARLVSGGVAHAIDQPMIVAALKAPSPAVIAAANRRHRSTQTSATARSNLAARMRATLATTPTLTTTTTTTATTTPPTRTVMTVLPTSDAGATAATARQR